MSKTRITMESGIDSNIHMTCSPLGSVDVPFMVLTINNGPQDTNSLGRVRQASVKLSRDEVEYLRNALGALL